MRQSLHRLVFGLLAGLLPALALAATASARISEFPTPTAKSRPQAITAGSDGALWFTETHTNKIGRITTSGTISEFPIPTARSNPQDITAGPDGALWFTETHSDKIGRITTSGGFSEFPIPTIGKDPEIGSGPVGITPGPDGALWFTENSAAKIGRITPLGSISEFSVPRGWPSAITVGRDGALWFTEDGTRKIGRMTPEGRVTTFRIAFPSEPLEIAAGPDGVLWVTDQDGNIGRIPTSGRGIRDFPAARVGALQGITAGPDRALWFTVSPNGIGRITTSGDVTEFPSPTARSEPRGIATGPDGALWFTEFDSNKIGRITVGCTVPRVRSLRIGRAKAKLRQAGCGFRVHGRGRVASSSPQAGAHTKKTVQVRGTRPEPVFGGRCRRPLAEQIAKSNSKAVLYSSPSEDGVVYYGCARSKGKLRLVAEESYSDAGFEHIHKLRLKSDSAIVFESFYTFEDRDYVYTQRVRINLRTGKRHRISFQPGVCVGDCDYEGKRVGKPPRRARRG